MCYNAIANTHNCNIQGYLRQFCLHGNEAGGCPWQLTLALIKENKRNKKSQYIQRINFMLLIISILFKTCKNLLDLHLHHMPT
jgi:hypothetical protein